MEEEKWREVREEEKEMREGDILNIENMPEFEQKKQINSPRTIEACKMEGIEPLELLYRPLESFKEIGKSQKVCQIRHDLINKKRLELIDIVKERRNKLMTEMSRYGSCPEGISTAPHAKSKSRAFDFNNAQRTKGGGSPTSTQYPVDIEDKVGNDMAKAEESVQKAKERELFLMEKMLRNEEIKNIKVEEQDNLRRIYEERKDCKEKIMRRKFKVNQEAKKQWELEKEIEMKKTEKKTRKEAEEKLRQDLEMKSLEKQKEIDKEKERMKIKKQIEIDRKGKLDKSKTQEEEMKKIQEGRLNKMKEKTAQTQASIKRKQEYNKRVSEEKRKQRELILARVQHNVDIEVINKMADYETKTIEGIKRDERLKRERDKLNLKLLEMGQVREKKIQEALNRGNKQEEEKKIILLERQRKVDKRIIDQKLKKEEEELVKKEAYIIKNEIKVQNAQRRMRKGEYEVTKIREKMVYNEERRLGFIKQRDALKDLRMKNQVYSEMQREGIRNTTYYMSVWNMWNMNVVRSIIGNPGAVKNKSIEALIINQAAITAKNKRTKQANSGESAPVSSRAGRRYQSSSKLASQRVVYNDRNNPPPKKESSQSRKKEIKSERKERKGSEVPEKANAKPKKESVKSKKEERKAGMTERTSKEEGDNNPRDVIINKESISPISKQSEGTPSNVAFEKEENSQMDKEEPKSPAIQEAPLYHKNSLKQEEVVEVPNVIEGEKEEEGDHDDNENNLPDQEINHELRAYEKYDDDFDQ